jgi:hypothetical protein
VSIYPGVIGKHVYRVSIYRTKKSKDFLEIIFDYISKEVKEMVINRQQIKLTQVFSLFCINKCLKLLKFRYTKT